MTSCHLYIEGLSYDAGVVEAHFGAPAAPLPRLLARAEYATLRANSHQPLALHGVQGHDANAVAPLMLAGEQGSFADGFWMCATPVHLRVEQDRLVLIDAQQLGLEGDEADALVATLATHFAEDDMQFVAPHPARWYTRLKQAPSIVTRPLADVIGRDIHPNLPTGPDSMLWHRRYNEVQMLLHAHPVNAAREARGLPPINSLWWWGGGTRPAVQRRFASISADDVLSRGIARLSATPLRSLPTGAAAWLSALEPGGEHYLQLDELTPAWAYREYPTWLEARTRIEQEWLIPLISALKDKRIRRLTIDAVTPQQAVRMTLSKSELWRFWRDWKRA